MNFYKIIFFFLISCILVSSNQLLQVSQISQIEYDNGCIIDKNKNEMVLSLDISTYKKMGIEVEFDIPWKELFKNKKISSNLFLKVKNHIQGINKLKICPIFNNKSNAFESCLISNYNNKNDNIEINLNMIDDDIDNNNFSGNVKFHINFLLYSYFGNLKDENIIPKNNNIKLEFQDILLNKLTTKNNNVDNENNIKYVHMIKSKADTYIQGGKYSNKNFGKSNQLLIKSHTNSELERRSYIMFSIPKRLIKNHMTLLLTINSLKLKDNKNGELVICQHFSDWNEYNLKYSTFNNNDDHQRYCTRYPLHDLLQNDIICTNINIQIETLSTNFYNNDHMNISIELLYASEPIGYNNFGINVKRIWGNSGDWLSIASKENNIYPSPTLIVSNNQKNMFDYDEYNQMCNLFTAKWDEHLIHEVECKRQYNNKKSKMRCHDMYGIGLQHDIVKQAVLYSPYDFSIGGGEKYFLEVASYFKSLNYKVIIITHDDNYCSDISCVTNTANALRVFLNSNQYTYLTLEKRFINKIITNPYDIFYTMGNKKLPSYGSNAKFAIYQCQFPYDINNTAIPKKNDILILSSYNLIAVNSIFTQSHYISSTLDIFMIMMNKYNIPFPNVEVIYPPVSISIKKNDPIKYEDKMNKKIINIIILGRIFDGRQNKGHKQGIFAFEKIYNSNKNVHLSIIGNIHPHFEKYSSSLVELASQKKLPITFHHGVSSKILHELMLNGDIFWQLTGIDNINNDPASYEHFGISIVEGMSYGMYPIVFCKGGGIEIIGDKYGSIICSIEDLIKSTLKYIKKPYNKKQLYDMRSYASRFNTNRFRNQFRNFMYKTRKSYEFNRKLLPFVSNTCASHNDMQLIASNNLNDKKIGTAYIFISKPISFLHMKLKNILMTLSTKWSFIIVYPNFNEVNIFIKKILKIAFGTSNIPNVKLLPIDIDKSISIDENYSNLLLSKIKFWNHVKTELITIFYTDSILLKSIDPIFNDYNNLPISYIGAPFCNNHELIEDGTLLSDNIGYGGLSIRNTSFSKYCLDNIIVQNKYHFIKNKKNEEIYFSICNQIVNYNYIKSYQKQLWKRATQFSVKIPCNQNFDFNEIIGLQSTWYYTNIKNLSNTIKKSDQTQKSCKKI